MCRNGGGYELSVSGVGAEVVGGVARDGARVTDEEAGDERTFARRKEACAAENGVANGIGDTCRERLRARRIHDFAHDQPLIV